MCVHNNERSNQSILLCHCYCYCSSIKFLSAFQVYGTVTECIDFATERPKFIAHKKYHNGKVLNFKRTDISIEFIRFVFFKCNNANRSQIVCYKTKKQEAQSDLNTEIQLEFSIFLSLFCPLLIAYCPLPLIK